MTTERGVDFARRPDESLVIVWCHSPENFEEIPPVGPVLANEVLYICWRMRHITVNARPC
jgi:hypothetical protein